MAFSIGIDYGTESGRVLLLDLKTGQEVAISVVPYRHGVIDKQLPESGEQLPPSWALQNPADYLELVSRGIPEVLRTSNVDPKDVVGIGVDFTSCTVLPVSEGLEPLCLNPKWRSRPHAWPKLWKHHAAQPYATRINGTAEKRGEAFIKRYGGSISSEWYFPKLLQIYEEDREVYDAAHGFMEAADWLVSYLVGAERRNSCTAGFKAMWSDADGLPGGDFFEDLSPGFGSAADKLGDTFLPLGTKAGTLRDDLASTLGMPAGIAVAVGNIDAHASVPGAGVAEKGAMVMVMGTSICHLTSTQEPVLLPGITGVVKDGVVPGLYGYEAGQAAVGDIFAWFVKTCVPADYYKAAEEQGGSIYEYLQRLAENLVPGQSGLVALDWWNGNRSTLGDADLSGVMVGLTLATSPEEIYRALLEAVAFGTRRILENFTANGVPQSRLVACGGLAKRSALLMQIYADVCQLEITVPQSDETSARGAALFGAVAAGEDRGGFSSITAACQALKPDTQMVYIPNADHASVYNQLYAIYSKLYDLFGLEQRTIAYELKELRKRAYRRTH